MNDVDQPNLPGVRLRAATPEDTPVILQLIRELADYEHLAHEVVESLPIRERHTRRFFDRRIEALVLKRWSTGFSPFRTA